jgi:hypothetical protein
MAVLLGVWPGAVNAQAFPPEVVSARSHSGQFIVHAQRSPGPAGPALNLTTDPNFLRLEPTLVAMSCERIKQVLSRELGGSAPWRGTIFLTLRPTQASGPTITITSKEFKTGWQYQVELPDSVERAQYLRAIVQVLLLEWANREANNRSAEIPLWLTEGFSQRLLTSDEVIMILPPPLESQNGMNIKVTHITERMNDPINQARKHLGSRPPLTFEQLSWPTESEIAGEAAESYRASAQLFVGELLRLPEGRPSLRAMLTTLPQYYNWQFAFLHAFHSHFDQPLDVEKWWALCLAPSTGRDVAHVWSAVESWQKLDQVIRSAAPARGGMAGPTLPAQVTLQTIIREWDRTHQTQALTSKLRELAVLRSRVAPDLAVLVQEYSQALEMYLRNHSRTGPLPRFGKRADLSRIAEDTVQRLDALDARREELRPAPPGHGGPAPRPTRSLALADSG